ncbi:MAG: hypothetical protein HOH94_16705, partial [Verrucomicrobia bacterium]|nr:hypothetical protein [Verrucomicrobiota bacterium]
SGNIYCYDGFGNEASDFEIQVSQYTDMRDAVTLTPQGNKFCFEPLETNEDHSVWAWLGEGGSIEELTPNAGPFANYDCCKCQCVEGNEECPDCDTSGSGSSGGGGSSDGGGGSSGGGGGSSGGGGSEEEPDKCRSLEVVTDVECTDEGGLEITTVTIQLNESQINPDVPCPKYNNEGDDK